jgi:hypothetical protein
VRLAQTMHADTLNVFKLLKYLSIPFGLDARLAIPDVDERRGRQPQEPLSSLQKKEECLLPASLLFLLFCTVERAN